LQNPKTLENQFIYPSPNLAPPKRLREGEGGVNLRETHRIKY